MPHRITIDKAYILGLLVGGGTIASTTFTIYLPYKNWGETPQRMSEIARDILTRIQSKFNSAYNISITYEIGNGRWTLVPTESADLEEIIVDLGRLGLPTVGCLLNTANLSALDGLLTPLKLKSFLSGVFDARGSIAASHRRFTNSAPIVSLEIPGSTRNFALVTQLCQMLTRCGSVTDQILYNHPCQHSSYDPTYKNWKKGFKIRFLAKTFLARYSFALQAKSVEISELERLQTISQQAPCLERISTASAVSVHEDINSPDLPPEVRGNLFLHYHHICAVLGCPYAPIDAVNDMVANANDYIYMFPILSKGEIEKLRPYFYEIINRHYEGVRIVHQRLSCRSILSAFPYESYKGIKGALAYLFSERVKGKRHCGSQDEIIESSLGHSIHVYSPDENDSPVLLRNQRNGRAAIISSAASDTNKRLIRSKVSISGDHIYVSR